MLGFSFAQQFQSFNVSQSDRITSENSVIVVDDADNLHIFWIEDEKEVRYRSRVNQNWSDVQTVYQSDTSYCILNITAQSFDDSLMVFFTDRKGDSYLLINCVLHNGVLQKVDTLKIYSEKLDKLHSAKNSDEITLAYQISWEDDSSMTHYDNIVYQYRSKSEWTLPYDSYYYAGTDFFPIYDPGDTLWYFGVSSSDNLYSCYLAPGSSQWSEWTLLLSTENCCTALAKIDCKYNKFSKKFNMVLMTPHIGCMDCFTEKIFYTEGYDTNWTDCQHIDRYGDIFQGQGSYSNAHIEVTSTGVPKIFYKLDYSDSYGDEYSIRRAERPPDGSSWNIEPILLFTTNDFDLCSTAIDSRDSVRLTYYLHYDVYLASKDDPSRLSHESLPQSVKTFRLFPTYPNPFNPQTTIQYSIPVSGHVRLHIFNVFGQEIRTLVDAKQSAGRHSVIWNGQNNFGERVASGIYFLRLKAHNFARTRKIILLD